MVLAIGCIVCFVTTMYDQNNLKYKIPKPLKEVIGSIASCIYESEFCQYSSADITTAIVTSAIQNKSQNGIAKSPDSDTVFWRIYNGLTFDRLEHLSKTQKPPKGTHIKVLIDGHDVMFYGKDALGLVGTKPKEGSSAAFKYLVAFSNTCPKGVVAIKELFDGSVTEDAMEIIKELHRDYTVDGAIMDGEFYKAELVEYLLKAKIHFIIRRANTGNIRDLDIKYSEPYLYKKNVERDGDKAIQLRYWIYRYHGIDGDFYLISDVKKKPEEVRREFKSRWNIETGFREVNRVRIKTTTRDFLVRLFFYIVSCIIYNLWQKIRFRFSLFVIRLDEVLDSIKKFMNELVLKPADILGLRRPRYIRLRIG